MESASIRIVALVRLATERLAPLAAGALVALLVDAQRWGRGETLRLLLQADAFEALYSPEFVEGLGERRLRSRQVLRAAFAMHPGAGAAGECVLTLSATGAIDVSTAPSIAAMRCAAFAAS